jgi:pyruvate-formate lyase-activating enzyme
VTMQDKAYYDESGGGVTVSGGEPTYQWPFVKAFLQSCKDKGIHAAIETCGFFNPVIAPEIVEACDVILFDLKHLDPGMHEQLTGQTNATILANLGSVHDLMKNRGDRQFLVRMPLVPGVNDGPEYLRSVEAFLVASGITSLTLLPYHSLYLQKIDDFFMQRMKLQKKPHTRENLETIQKIFTRVHVSFGG